MKELDVLVTGAGGQLGQELVRMRLPGIRIIGFERGELDVTDPEVCLERCMAFKPDAVIHAAAYTSVDRAESEPQKAYMVNVKGTRNMAEAAEAVNAKFCYVSTDYVFDGNAAKPYRESDPTAPLNVYGRTKRDGENEAMAGCSRTFVVRTSWLYGRYGNNFVKTIMEMAQSDRDRPVSVVDDQTGAPTYARDLAGLLLEMMASERYGLYHASNSGSCTWYQFARAIIEECGLDVELTPCTTAEFPRPARRPKYSVLAGIALIGAGFSPLRHWREALRDYLRGK